MNRRTRAGRGAGVALLLLATITAYAAEEKPSHESELAHAMRELRAAAGNGATGVSQVEAALKDPRAPLRAAAVQMLYDLKGRGAIPLVAPMVQDPDEGVVVAAAGVLIRAGGDGTEAPIRKALASALVFVRAQTTGYIGDARDARFVKDLGGLLSDEAPGVRRSAIEALRAIGSPEAFPFYMAASGDKDEAIAVSAIEGLQALKDGRATVRLAALCTSPSEKVRDAVAHALPALGAVSADTGPFSKLLRDPAAGVRQAAAFGLRDAPAASGLPALRLLLADGEPGVRRAALQALRDNPAPGATALIVAALTDTDANVRASAVAALVTRHASDQMDRIVALAGDPEDRVRNSVASAIGAFSRPSDVAALERLAKDPSVSVRVSAVASAGKMPADRALALLDGALSDADPGVRREAVIGLGTLGTPAALKRLRAIAAGGEVDLRVEAIDALRERKDRDALDVLRKAAQDPVERVRAAARKALEALGG